MPVQKQTRAGQRTRFKAFVIVGDSDGHFGLGVKCAKEVATAIRGAIIDAMRQMGNDPRRVHAQLRAMEAGDRFQDAMLEEDSAAPASTSADAEQRLDNYLAGIATAMAVGFLASSTGADPEDVQDRDASPE